MIKALSHFDRWIAIAKKEWWQLSRDRLTLVLLISVPLAQIILFGFAIEIAPKNWPGVWQVSTSGSNVSHEIKTLNQMFQQEMLRRIGESQLLKLPTEASTAEQAEEALVSGRAKMVLHLPHITQTELSKGESITIILESDASDPQVRIASAQLGQSMNVQLQRMLGQVQIDENKALVKLHARFANAQGSGAFLVPALAGVILTLTLILMSAFSLVRERERGTWDSLRSTRVNAAVIIIGKMAPYFLIGFALFSVMQVIAITLFGSTLASAMQWFIVCAFILCQLGLGAAIGLFAQSQIQAMQLGVFLYLPSILLSGFMFPVHAMPRWAQGFGEVLPMTHFLRVLRADLFRHADAQTLLALGWPIFFMATIIFLLVMMAYQRRLN